MGQRKDGREPYKEVNSQNDYVLHWHLLDEDLKELVKQNREDLTYSMNSRVLLQFGPQEIHLADGVFVLVDDRRVIVVFLYKVLNDIVEFRAKDLGVVPVAADIEVLIYTL